MIVSNDWPPRPTLALYAGALVGAWALLVWRFWFVCDDAFISFRYAHNWGNGLGLIYHPLDQPPVEGYSHLLWVLWLGLGERCGVAPEHLAPATSALCGLLLLCGVVRGVLAAGARPAAAAGAALLLIGMPPFAVWSTGGLETMPAALAGWIVFRGLLGPGRRRPVAAAAAGGALVLLRPEGPALLAALLTIAALGKGARSPTNRSFGPLVLTAVVAGLAIGGQLLFRMATYGDWLPNTVRAKGDFTWFRAERGLCYLGSFALVFPGVAVMCGLGAAALREAAHRRLVFGALALGAVHAAFAVRVGGDFMPMGRFLVPALPLLACVAGLGLDTLLRAGRGWLAWALVGVAVAANMLPAFDLHAVPAALRDRCDFRWGLPQPATEFATWRDLRLGARDDEVLARALNRHTRAGESLIGEAVGVVGHRTHLRLLDTFGLVTARPDADFTWLPRGTPGHDRFLPWTVLLDRRPDYLHAHLAAPDESESCPMLATPLQVSPLAQRVELLRFPVDEPDARGRTVELRLLHFVAHDDPTAPLASLLAAVAGIDPADPAAGARLRDRLPAAAAAALAETMLVPAVLDRLTPHSAGPLRFGHVADPTRRTHSFWIDALRQGGAGLPTALPRGKLVYALPLDGAPRISGQEPGWIVVPPTASHTDVVAGGTALLLQFVPDGKMRLLP